MGVILDSSVIIAAERRGRTVPQILEQMTAPERQKVVEKTPKQSFRTTSRTTIFLLECRSTAGRILPVLAATCGVPVPLVLDI